MKLENSGKKNNIMNIHSNSREYLLKNALIRFLLHEINNEEIKKYCDIFRAQLLNLSYVIVDLCMCIYVS